MQGKEKAAESNRLAKMSSLPFVNEQVEGITSSVTVIGDMKWFALLKQKQGTK